MQPSMGQRALDFADSGRAIFFDGAAISLFQSRATWARLRITRIELASSLLAQPLHSTLPGFGGLHGLDFRQLSYFAMPVVVPE